MISFETWEERLKKHKNLEKSAPKNSSQPLEHYLRKRKSGRNISLDATPLTPIMSSSQTIAENQPVCSTPEQLQTKIVEHIQHCYFNPGNIEQATFDPSIECVEYCVMMIEEAIANNHFNTSPDIKKLLDIVKQHNPSTQCSVITNSDFGGPDAFRLNTDDKLIEPGVSGVKCVSLWNGDGCSPLTVYTKRNAPTNLIKALWMALQMPRSLWWDFVSLMDREKLHVDYHCLSSVENFCTNKKMQQWLKETTDHCGFLISR